MVPFSKNRITCENDYNEGLQNFFTLIDLRDGSATDEMKIDAA